MVGSEPVRTTEEATRSTILRLVLALEWTAATVFPAGVCRLTALLSFLCHLEPAALPSLPPCFLRRLYGGRLARTYRHRRDSGLRPLGPHRSPPPAARPRRDHRPPSATGSATGLFPRARPQPPRRRPTVPTHRP